MSSKTDNTDQPCEHCLPLPQELSKTESSLDRCDSEACGMSNWSCNRLQDLVYDDMPITERRKLAAQIREDMKQFQDQAIVSAHQQGWHEGRAAANNPEIKYGYTTTQDSNTSEEK